MEPAKKRKRTASPAASISQTIYEHSTDVYFPDGKIILVAENTAFRVHKGQLAHHSVVFQDMFTVARDGEISEGCPVVQLSDKRHDLAALLETLYCIKYLETQGFHFIASVLLLASKYLIDPLRKRAMDHLGLTYPRTLDQWDARNIQNEHYPGFLVVLAREAQATALLPAARYRLCAYKSGELGIAPMTPSDLCQFIRGQDELAQIFPKYVHNQYGRFRNSGRPDLTRQWEALIFQRLLHIPVTHLVTPDPLKQLADFARAVEALSTLTAHEKKNIREKVQNKRQKIWNEFHKLSNLGTWEELKG